MGDLNISLGVCSGGVDYTGTVGSSLQGVDICCVGGFECSESGGELGSCEGGLSPAILF